MLKIDNLNVWYGGIHAVKGIDIAIDKGSIVTLIGANGAGKSSTIRAIAGLVKGYKGDITYTDPKGASVSLNGRPPEQMVKLGISLSPEGRRILPHLTVEENLRLGAYIRNDKDGVNADIEYVYTLFPRLKERISQMAGTLSGGEQQMLAMGRALMSRPKLLLLDEPSMGLAPILVKEIFNIIKEIHDMGTTVLLVEQNARMALSISDYAYVLETGTISLQGEARTLAESEDVKKAYLGG